MGNRLQGSALTMWGYAAGCLATGCGLHGCGVQAAFKVHGRGCMRGAGCMAICNGVQLNGVQGSGVQLNGLQGNGQRVARHRETDNARRD